MSEQIILPGQLSNLDTSMTSKDFTSDITSNNIKSTFFKEGEEIEFPCVCLDLSNAGAIIKTSMEALKQLLVTDEVYKESLKLESERFISVYIHMSGGKKVLIGHMREYTARHLLPSFIKSTFPNGTTLYISEDGSRVDEFTKTTLAGVKLEFSY